MVLAIGVDDINMRLSVTMASMSITVASVMTMVSMMAMMSVSVTGNDMNLLRG